MGKQLLLKLFQLSRRLRLLLPAHLLHEIDRCQLQSRILKDLLSIRKLIRILSHNQIRELDADLRICTVIYGETVHSHSI